MLLLKLTVKELGASTHPLSCSLIKATSYVQVNTHPDGEHQAELLHDEQFNLKLDGTAPVMGGYLNDLLIL